MTSEDEHSSAPPDFLRATAFVLGDDVNTDVHCSAKYLPGKDEAFIAAHAFDRISPGFGSRFRPGGVIVAGKNFGINSSREQAVSVLRLMGVAAVLAPIFGRQFFRNAINNGLSVVEVDTGGIMDGDVVSFDRGGNLLSVPVRGISRPLLPLNPVIGAILKEGGLLPFLRKYPDWQLPT